MHGGDHGSGFVSGRMYTKKDRGFSTIFFIPCREHFVFRSSPNSGSLLSYRFLFGFSYAAPGFLDSAVGSAVDFQGFFCGPASIVVRGPGYSRPLRSGSIAAPWLLCGPWILSTPGYSWPLVPRAIFGFSADSVTFGSRLLSVPQLLRVSRSRGSPAAPGYWASAGCSAGASVAGCSAAGISA